MIEALPVDGSLETARAGCAHCGNEVPAGLARAADPAGPSFCCAGCRAAHEMILACGLESFYSLRRSDEETAGPARTTGNQYREFDDPVFQGLHCRPIGAFRSVDLHLEGVHCGACVWLLEKLPTVIEGVREAKLVLHRSLLHLVWDPAFVDLSEVARTLDGLGYPPHPSRSAQERESRLSQDRRDIGRIALAGALAGNIMIMAVALYGGLFGHMNASDETLFRYGNMVLGMISLLGPGRVFMQGAWAALVTRSRHLDLPIALALVAGGLGGFYNTVVGSGEIYFDSLSVLVFFLLVGRFLQRRQQRWAEDSLELLFSLSPRAARRVRAETIEDVPVEALVVGDVVEVRAEESIPVDGVVLEGRSAIDQSLLTGEVLPVAVCAGSMVAAGTVNRESMLRMRVAATGRDTRIGQLMRLVEECTRRRAPIEQYTDRISVIFVTWVAILGLGTLLGWTWAGSSRALDHAVALLVVACPCALGLATPLALAVSIGRAARRKILVKGGDAFENLAGTGLILLDKTGTLTTGALEVRAWRGSRDCGPQLGAIEARSQHPIARALVASLEKEGVVSWEGVLTVKQTGAGGIEATLAGESWRIGSPTFVTSGTSAVHEEASSWIEELAEQGLSPVCISRNGRIEAVLGLGDRIRDGVPGALAHLRERGWQIGLLSGDHARVVERVAGDLGIPRDLTYAGQMPEEKLAIVRRHRVAGPVVMVGDGVNDAAALAEATVGIAVHGGAEASLAAADVYLARPGLRSLVSLIDAARNALAVIRRCLRISIAYNALGVALAAAGLIHPLLAAILMPLSSLSVVGLCLGSTTFEEE